MGLAAIENEVISWDKKIKDDGKFYVEGTPGPIEAGKRMDMEK